jgi:predicted nucleic acid-binding protein
MVVVDASVILKWLLEDPAAERDTERATELMRRVMDGDVNILQPVHWLAEVGAVLARLSPETAVDDVEMLHALEIPVRDDTAVSRRACQLAIDLDQHLFDTLYHAVALECDGARLITADGRYLRAAKRYAAVVPLAEWGVG